MKALSAQPALSPLGDLAVVGYGRTGRDSRHLNTPFGGDASPVGMKAGGSRILRVTEGPHRHWGFEDPGKLLGRIWS